MKDTLANGTNGVNGRAHANGDSATPLKTQSRSREAPSFATNLVHADAAHYWSEPTNVIPSISLSTTFRQTAPAEHSGFEYSRAGNPNRLAFESLLASLELPKDTQDAALLGPYTPQHLPPALGFASGSATTATIVQALVGANNHVLSVADVYGGTYRYFTKVASATGIKVDFVDLSLAGDTSESHEAIEARLEGAFKPNTKVVWLESPTNPTLRLVDIRRLVEIAHSKGALVVADNTFASPYYQRPLALGADIVVHSITKYINGHSDVVGGALVTRQAKLLDTLRFHQNATGAVPSPFDSWLAIRGARTLELRMQRHGLNSLAVARYLASNPAISEVIYPGLETSTAEWNRQLAWDQLSDEAREWIVGLGYSVQTGFPFSGMVSARLDPSFDADAFLASLKVFTLAESLGGVESLAELPGKMTHASVSEEDRAKLGIDNQLVRFSVGIEETKDLIKDLEQALDKARR